jgi:hypothetical protein
LLDDQNVILFPESPRRGITVAPVWTIRIVTTQEHSMRWLLIPLLALLLAACSTPFAAAPTATPDPCAPAALTAYGETVQTELTNYFAQLGIAQATPRVGLGPVLQALFEAEKAVKAVAAPDCLADFRGRTISMMELYRISMNQFAAQKEANSMIDQAQADKIRAVIEPAVATIVAGQVPELPPE